VLLKKRTSTVRYFVSRTSGRFCLRRRPLLCVLSGSRRPPGLVPSCAEAACWAFCPAYSLIQATETVKLILVIGQPHGQAAFALRRAGHLKFRELKLRRESESAPAAATIRLSRSHRDYQEFCGIQHQPTEVRVKGEIDAKRK